MGLEKHISDKVLVRLAEGKIQGEEYEELMNHIIGCDDCRFRYVVLRKYMKNTNRRIPLSDYVSRFASLLAGLLLFISSSVYFSRFTPTFRDTVPARYVNDTAGVSVYTAPRLKYIYIDTLALHFFYLRGQMGLFKFQMEPHGNLVKVKAKPSR